jgi:putative ABC transport system substrate-binding protein
MALVGDPVAMGFVSNLARPGANVTGISTLSGELSAKRLALLREVVPTAKRIAVMFNPSDPVNAVHKEEAQRVAPALNVELRFFPVKETAELPETFKQMLTWRADAAVWLTGQSQAFQPRAIELAARHRLPILVRSTSIGFSKGPGRAIFRSSSRRSSSSRSTPRLRRRSA